MGTDGCDAITSAGRSVSFLSHIDLDVLRQKGVSLDRSLDQEIRGSLAIYVPI